MKKFDNIIEGSSSRREGVDYLENENHFILFNIPIMAEMVQYYQPESLDDEFGGFAYKPADEILKVKVNNVPLTMVDYEPAHPGQLISQMGTLGKTDVIVGYMSEPSRPKPGMSSTKRYVDFVFQNTPKINMLKELYKQGKDIDTSVGFKFRADMTPGTFLGDRYDYVQRDIVLDHNAVLIDKLGNLGVGRMPNPIGGIGADTVKFDQSMNDAISDMVSQYTNDNPDLDKNQINLLILEDMRGFIWGDDNLNEKILTTANELVNDNEDLELKTVVSIMLESFRSKTKLDSNTKNLEEIKVTDIKLDAMAQENATMKAELDAIKKADATGKLDAAKKDAENAKTDAEKVKLDLDEANKKIDAANIKLKVFEDAEAEKLKVKVDALKEANPKFEKLFDKADPAYIDEKYDELVEAKKQAGDIGTDMMGLSGSSQKTADNTQSYINNLDKKVE